MSLVTRAGAEELARLLAPIDQASPAGLFDIEDETYQSIDQEMVKLGGLQESAIDWPYIEKASREYLSRRCKHLRIVGHLSVAWLRNGTWEHWCHALELLAGMIEHHWQTAYPDPGPTGLRGKRRLVDVMLKRLRDALPRLDRFSYTPTLQAVAQQALLSLQRQVEPAKLDAALLSELEQGVLKQSQKAVGDARIEAPKPNPAQGAAPLAETLLGSKPEASLGNERETRRAVLNMAELINRQDPYDPAGYQLRRFGLWAHISAAPAAGQALRTELMAVPADIVAGYEEAIAGGGMDTGLLLRVEKSVTASPFWIRGSFFAASIANGLAMGEVAEAIRAATARFVQRLPSLQQLCFSDGTCFVDDQCLAWLQGVGNQPDQHAHPQEFRGLHEELANQLATDGIEPVLLALQGLHANYHSPRERCHTTVIAADLLATRGVSWLAQDLCASVARTMCKTTADVWEPEIFQKLRQYGTSSVLTDPSKD